MSDAIEIRAAINTDAADISRLHEDLLHGDLSSLGVRAIALVYAAILEQGLADVYVAVEKDVPIGFVVIAKDEREVVASAIDGQRLRVGWAANKVALTRAFLGSVIQARSENIGPTLMYIAVHPDARGTDCAKLLVGAAEQNFRAKGATEYALRVNAGNSRALNFYYKMGFHASGYEARWAQLILKKHL